MKTSLKAALSLSALIFSACVSTGSTYEPTKFKARGASQAELAAGGVTDAAYTLQFNETIQEFNRKVPGAGLHNEIKFDNATKKLVYDLLKPHFKSLAVAGKVTPNPAKQLILVSFKDVAMQVNCIEHNSGSSSSRDTSNCIGSASGLMQIAATNSGKPVYTGTVESNAHSKGFLNSFATRSGILTGSSRRSAQYTLQTVTEKLVTKMVTAKLPELMKALKK